MQLIAIHCAQKLLMSCVVGVEFLMSTQAFYCSLCDVFLGSCTCAETHCKSEEHNSKYAVSCHIKQFHIEHSVCLPSG